MRAARPTSFPAGETGTSLMPPGYSMSITLAGSGKFSIANETSGLAPEAFYSIEIP